MQDPQETHYDPDEPTDPGSEEPTTEEDQLTGVAYLEFKERQLLDRLARRSNSRAKFAIADVRFDVGDFVRHHETDAVFEVLGHRQQGGDRGYSLKVRDIETNDERNVMPWTVTEHVPDAESDDAVDE